MCWKITTLLAGVLLTVGAAGAQESRPSRPEAAMISVSGSARVRRHPMLLRVYLQLSAKGKTVEEAIAALKERRESAQAQLEKLGANKGSVVCNGPWMDHSSNARQKRMEMMIVQRMGSRGKKAAKTAKPPVAVTSLVTAEWPLEGDTPEKLLLAAESLREKIRAADVGGADEAEKLSPEEQEAADEMAGQMPSFVSPGDSSDDEASAPGQPHLLFVAKITPKDRQAAIAKALTRAKAKAVEMAQAAGADLGRLVNLSAGGSQEAVQFNAYNQMGDDNPFGQNGAYLMQRLVRQQASDDEQTIESVGTSPSLADFDFTVQATFALDASSVGRKSE
jgi:hypothetical protein